MKIVITAANGYIGKQLLAFFAQKNVELIAIVRNKNFKFPNVKTVFWDGETVEEWFSELNGADAIINLAGKSVNCRYNEKNKSAVYHSRLASTKAIGEAINLCHDKPKVWLNAASATIYAHSEKIPNTESNHVIGEGFSVDVCQKWEAEFFAHKQVGVRQIVMRTAIVLAKNGSVMEPFKRLVKVGLGGRMGKGNQQFSWIHVTDFCRAIEFCIHTDSMQGAINFSAPHPVTNGEFMKSLRKWLRRPFGIPSPKWLLKIGTRMIGTETELVLKSRFVLPEKLIASGFEFNCKTVNDLIDDFKR